MPLIEVNFRMVAEIVNIKSRPLTSSTPMYAPLASNNHMAYIEAT